jgi:hypothetical protein
MLKYHSLAPDITRVVETLPDELELAIRVTVGKMLPRLKNLLWRCTTTANGGIPAWAT